MFINVKTDKDESLLLNSDKILFILEDKKGKTVFYLDDGTSFTTFCSLDFYNALFTSIELRK